MLYEKIDTYLKENGIKRTYVAKKAGISNATITAIMQGKRKLLATEYADICSALNVSLDKFNTD